MRKSILAIIIIFVLLALGIIAYHKWFSPDSRGGTTEVVDALGRTIKVKTPVKR